MISNTFHLILHCRMSGAESLPFSDESVQLVTTCQACHWFDMPAFYKEVHRILQPGHKFGGVNIINVSMREGG